MEQNIPGASATDNRTTYTYAYDNRGNLIREDENHTLLHDYEYGAVNRLTKAADHTTGRKAHYTYNGIGQRTAKTISYITETAGTETDNHTEDYLLDLTKPYHNLIGLQRDGKRQTFYYDGNLSAMEEDGQLHYYLLDDLGSPLRVSGYEEKNPETPIGIRDYLTYGYDEFGNDLGNDLKESGIPNPYTVQGEHQPFGYIGYRYDTTSATYFAQAREYRPESGRFTAEDVIKGNGLVPETMNPYVYCWNSPLVLVHLDGREPEDYKCIYYVNNPDAAGGMGHTAFLLVKENNMAEYYSYSTVTGEIVGKIFDTPNDKKEYEGRFFTNVSSENTFEPEEVNIDYFINKGSLNERWYSDGIWKNREDGVGPDTYTRGIIIPITDEQGEKIHNAAQELLYSESVYNLWINNCVQVARRLISTGGEGLVLSQDINWLNNYPTTGGNMYATLALTSGVIPNQDYTLALLTAEYYGYETIEIGKGQGKEKEQCVDD